MLEWLFGMAENGPSSGALPVPMNDEFWMDRVPGTQTVVRFIVVVYERLVIVKDLHG